MDLSSLRSVLLEDPALAQAVRAGQGRSVSPLDLGAPRPLRPFIIAALAAAQPTGAGRPVLAVTATDREATDLVAALGALLDPDSVAEYPAWETLPHERLSPRADTVGRRLAVRRRLRHPDDGQLSVVVTPVRALVQPQVAGLGDLEPVALHVGDEAVLDDVVGRLIGAGYTRVDLVERRGEIAVRGGILDVFPPTEDHPLRVEFFGDDVEEIRVFKAADQRSLGDDFPAPRGLWAPPCRELLLTPQVLERAESLAEKHPQLADILGKVANGVAVEGMESLASVLVDKMDLLLDEMPLDTVVLLCDPERVRARAAEVLRTGEEFLQAAWAGAASGGKAPIDLSSAALRPLGDVRTHALSLGLAWWSVSPLAVTTSQVPASDIEADGDVLVIDAVAAQAYRGDTQAVVADVKGWLADGWRVLFTTAG
ncbi:MAG TPA: transcription-repair coupling factor, partial [Acidothermaceae bacterium]|nr:transcription-repair coupling factor [Acidothermaceae bacterium]